jgi:hypothetical protein
MFSDSNAKVIVAFLLLRLVLLIFMRVMLDHNIHGQRMKLHVVAMGL